MGVGGRLLLVELRRHIGVRKRARCREALSCRYQRGGGDALDATNHLFVFPSTSCHPFSSLSLGAHCSSVGRSRQVIATAVIYNSRMRYQ